MGVFVQIHISWLEPTATSNNLLYLCIVHLTYNPYNYPSNAVGHSLIKASSRMHKLSLHQVYLKPNDTSGTKLCCMCACIMLRLLLFFRVGGGWLLWCKKCSGGPLMSCVFLFFMKLIEIWPGYAEKSCMADRTWYRRGDAGLATEKTNYNPCSPVAMLKQRTNVHVTAYAISTAALLPALLVFYSYKYSNSHINNFSHVCHKTIR